MLPTHLSLPWIRSLKNQHILLVEHTQVCWIISIFKTAPSLCQAYLTHITVTTMQYLQILHCMAINNCFAFFFFFFLRLGLGQWRAVVIIGRWLLPSLVDTGDICCHYWQHILVTYAVKCRMKLPIQSQKLQQLHRWSLGVDELFHPHNDVIKWKHFPR